MTLHKLAGRRRLISTQCSTYPFNLLKCSSFHPTYPGAVSIITINPREFHKEAFDRYRFSKCVQFKRRPSPSLLNLSQPRSQQHSAVNLEFDKDSLGGKTAKEIDKQSIMVSLSKWEWLPSMSPGFPVHGSQLKIITDPSTFYSTLVEKSKLAKNRISNASLYLGNGELEKKYVGSICENLKRNPDLKIKILLDYTRGSRGENNSRTMLLPLLKESPSNCEIFLFHTPTLRGLVKRFLPQRWNEIIGLQHMKIYVFDDDVLISGANLSNDYFTNRQDRYLLIEGSKPLADFYDGLIDQVCNFSFQLNTKNETHLKKNWTIHPAFGDQSQFISSARTSILSYYNHWKEGNPTRISSFFSNLTSEGGDNLSYDTWIFPLIQMGPLGINLDNVATSKMFQEAQEGGLVKLATGYFNLTPDYVDLIVEKSRADFQILMAHPKANGFLGASFPAGGIPSAYSLVAKKFLEKIKFYNQEPRINLWEYFRPSWTFHAKGLWFYPPGSTLPLVTLIGSPNFGQRSVYRDLETQLYIVSTNEGYRKALHEEQEVLWIKSKPFNEQVLVQPERGIPLWVKMVIYFFRNFF